MHDDDYDLQYQLWYNTTGTGTEYSEDDMSQYEVIGDLFGGYHGTCIHHNTIEGTYNREVNHKVKAIDLMITGQMYQNIVDYNEDAEDFKCNINGVTDEEYEYIVPFSYNSYLMRWIFDNAVEVDNDTINVAFYTPTSTFGSGLINSWCVMINDEDNNNDNIIEFKYSDGITQFSNGEYDGTVWSTSYDLVFRIYYEQKYIILY